MKIPTTSRGTSARLHAYLPLLLFALAGVSNPDSAHADMPRTEVIKDFGNLLNRQPTWEPIPPPYRRSDASTFSGQGVRVGLIESGFSLRQPPQHVQALSGVLRPEFSVEHGASQASHLATVARIVAGRNIGDAFSEGVAPNSHLYLEDGAFFTGSLVFVQFNKLSVAIINNSWGWGAKDSNHLDELYKSKGAAAITAHFRTWIDLFKRAVNDHKQLLIWAAGNALRPSACWPPMFAVVAPALETGWLAVTSIHPDGTLRLPSNACGLAANFCLSAVEGKLEGSSVGTSFATPVVTGVAALVSEAYPWMDNHALRQTLLSTADSLGPPEIYGWGRVNADRAVRGPALFDARLTFGRDFVAEFDGYRADFYNDIGGDRGLIKRGTGTLVLWGNNTYAGTTRIQHGFLELYGRVAGSVVVGDRGGLYSDGGKIGGTLNNANTVSIVGKGLQVHGDYVSAQSGGYVDAQLGAVLTVEGTARLSGTKWLILPPAPRYVWKETEVLVQAGSIMGELDEVLLFGMYEPKVVYTATRAEVVISRNNIETLARESFPNKPTFTAAATAVETAFTTIDEDLQDQRVTVSEEFVAEAGVFQQIPSPVMLAKTLDSLTGEVYASSQALSFQQAQLVNRVLAHRVDALRQRHQDEGLWIEMLTANGKLRQRGYTGADTRLFGAQLGADTRWSYDKVIGAAFAWSDAKASFHGLGGRSQGQSRGGALYGRFGADTGSYVFGRIGHDWIATDVSREIVIGTSKSIDSTRHDRLASVYAELGHVVASGQSAFTPYVGLEYNRLRRGAFQETGSAFALRAPTATYQQGAASLGMRYQSSPISWLAGQTTLMAAGAYRYANAAALDFTAAFIGAPNAAFRLRGIGLPRHSGWLGLGTSTRLNSRHLQWFINVDMQLDHNGIDSHVVSAGMKYEFQ